MKRTASPIRLAFLVLAMASLGCGNQEIAPIKAGGRDVAAWVADLHHRDPRVRRQAVLKLGNIGDADPAVSPAIGDALSDRDPLVRRDAIFATVKLKTPPPAVLDQLFRMGESDRDPKLRDIASRALAKLKKAH